ncbi:DUF803-domain-containing protein [Phlegmacium glaucopus]|nr:DUF803-domain-containing protein [Phlegmacium glaucopus]
MDGLPTMTTQTFIGISVAITGNILISLALNLQKLAHKRVETRKKALTNRKQLSEDPSLDEHDEDRELLNFRRTPVDVFSNAPSESQPLIPFPESESTLQHYGTDASPGRSAVTKSSDVKRSTASRPLPTRFLSKKAASGRCMPPDDNISAEEVFQGLPTTHKGLDVESEADYQKEGNEGDYLKSRLWWLGFLLMNVGELGNFISYAFAPASVVAPLGTFALIANCFFAPALLGEYFRKRDLIGVVIAIIGAVTVVLASDASDTRLGPDELLEAISQIPFIVYSSIYVAGAILLATLSEGSIGRTWVFVDIGICALFGGFTVLSTKALSTLLTLEWIDIFTKWITYPLIAVLIFTGVGQIRYLNRALMRFDGKVVIPIQFVLFTLSAIIGSAILYGDFQKANFHEIITFFYGCAATFAGVFIIAWGPSHSGSELDHANESGEELPNATDPRQMSPGNSRHRLGSIGRRKWSIPVLPGEGVGHKDTPTQGRTRSGLSIIGMSPAQHLLLVHTPPREIPTPQYNGEDVDVERDAQTSESYRRRTMSWYGYEGNGERSGRGTRESSIVGRLRNGGVRVGSLDGQQNSSIR